ncbi:hypothetical protein N7510_009564 [Penicillium lagena]|uniref:uncharacterized protein n=1 Tax=Penicillium lagena TaxID=94218 RepID=UPI002541A457|nr:uncharacterized protein N7510_009564 [Penicillium lagena]KAJ5604410.1 hypothetical protein N7510_009564 [Penicillium lagena]
MPPDLNSLPPSRSSSSSSSLPHRNIPQPVSPGSGPIPMNANTSPRPSRASPSVGRLSVSERRRSAAGMNLNLTESGPGPSNNGDAPLSDHRSSIGQALRTASPSNHGGSPIFATADPHHQRAPSLGELHQELEQEQEAQVNRLLQMIRSQQAQLQQLQNQQQQTPQSAQSGTAVVDDTPPSERSAFFPPIPPPAGISHRPSISSVTNRRSSRTSSQATSPNLRPLDSSRGSEAGETLPAARESVSRRGSRDEGAYYQAEAAMLGRENQMLRQRIRELERQINDLTTASSAARPEVASGQAGPETGDPPSAGSTRKE